MFTGIIENIGKTEEIKKNGFVFSVNKSFCKKIKKGTSVSVNGVCLTVVSKKTNNFFVEVMPETQNKTMLTKLKNKDAVNLELPATASTLLSGHIVQGHVDGVGKVVSVEKDGNSHVLKIETNREIMNYIVNKGSVTLNGVSLTVVWVKGKNFVVSIIPFTWKNTTLGLINVGDKINIETDVLGKYLKKFLNK